MCLDFLKLLAGINEQDVVIFLAAFLKHKDASRYARTIEDIGRQTNDSMLGIFTGKTKSLNIGDNLIPIASIVAGAFIKNPILKMLMIGFGGANLLNKAGHEVLDWQQNNANNSKSKENIRYRIYQEEALNPRISNPILQGGNLIAVIDRIPCTIQLPEKVIAAYNAGALPLNTLANAILAKCDQTQQLAEMNYENKDRETIIRTRGIQ